MGHGVLGITEHSNLICLKCKCAIIFCSKANNSQVKEEVVAGFLIDLILCSLLQSFC